MATTERSLYAAAAWYVCIFGAFGALLPYLPLLLEDRGHDAATIGLVLSVMPLCDALAPPAWGMLADYLGARTRVMRIAAVGASLTVLLILGAHSVAAIIASIAIFCVFRSAQVPLGDATTRSLLKDRPEAYGRVRVWGSIAFAAVAATLGAVHASEVLLIIVPAVFYMLAAGVSFGLPAAEVPRRTPVARATREILTRPTFVALLAGTTLYYAAHATYDAFMSLHFVSLGVPRGMIGAAWAIGVSAEVVVMFAAPRLFARVDGRALLPFAASIAVIRWTLTALLTSPTALIATQALHGITFGLWYLALVDAAQREAPAHLRSTVQSFTIASLGAGRFVGYSLGGQWYHLAGSGALFLSAAAVSAVAVAVYFWGWRAGQRAAV